MQTSLQKHHRILLGALLAITVASFVFYVGPSGTPAFEGKYMDPRTGVNLLDDRATRPARDLAAFTIATRYSRPLHTDDFLSLAKRAAIRQKAGEKGSEDPEFSFFLGTFGQLSTADALGIPAPDAKQLKEFVQKYPVFTDTSGAFAPARLKQFSDFAHDRLGLDDRRLQTAIANAWRIQKLAAVAAPDEAPALDVLAARLSEKERARWTVETALFSREGYTVAVPQDEKAIAAYFEANKENYRVPQKLRLRVAKVAGDIKTADTLPAPSDDELYALAERRRDRFPLVGIATKTDFLKENRATLLLTWREEKAGEAAAAKLSETLVTAIPLGDTRPDTAKVDAMIKAAGLTATALPLYGSDALPTGTGLPDALLEGALKLTAERWRTAAIPFGANAYMFVYDGAEPSRIPALAEVRSRVTADRDAEETDRLFAEAATAKAAALAAAVKSGKNFAEAATAAGLKPAAAVNFEFRQPPENLAVHRETLDTLPVGGVTGALRAGRDRLVAHVISRLAPDAVKDDAVATQIRRKLGSFSSSLDAQALSGGTED